MKLYMFQTVHLSIIRSLFTVHSAVVYVIQVCIQLLGRTSSIRSCPKAVYKPVWHIPLLSVQRINSWWWTDKLSKTCWVSCQNKFVKLVYLLGFIVKKFVTMHGHMNIKKKRFYIFADLAVSISTWTKVKMNTSSSKCWKLHTSLHGVIQEERNFQ